MEGAVQRVKALASQLRSMIKDEIDSTTAKINHVRESVREAMESVREAMERIDQKLAEQASRTKERNESESFQTSNQSVEVVMPCRRENNDDDEDEESEVDDFSSAIGSSDYIQVDEDEFLDFQDMEKDEAAGEDGAVPLVADVVVGGEANKF